MNYQNAKLRRMLAAEYVLGTLRGPARRRFERLARGDAALRAEQHFWESRLGPLLNQVHPVAPAPTVWISLQRRIESGNTRPLRPAAAPKPATSWRLWAGAAAAAMVVAVVMLSQRGVTPTQAPTPVAQAPDTAPPPVAAVNPPPAPPAAAVFVAQLKVPHSTMQWTVNLKPANGEMTVSAAGDYPKLGKHSMELWWISANGPVAIGLLPVKGDGSMALPKELASAGNITLAVSMEPQGGSPTGKPTGPVVTSGPAVAV
jgi:anti-sigma-K factor RskA